MCVCVCVCVCVRVHTKCQHINNVLSKYIKELVLEKETRLRESMKMMGLSGWILWLTWYIKQFLFLVISVIIMTILIKVSHFTLLCTHTHTHTRAYAHTHTHLLHWMCA